MLKILCFFFCLSFVFGCGNSSSSTPQGSKNLTILKDCIGEASAIQRNTSETILSDTERSTDKTYVSFLYKNGSVVLTHLNAAFNCCPSKIDALVEINGSTIIVREEETFGAGICECNCLYDLEIELSNIDPKMYTVEIIEPYVTTYDDPIEIDIDFSATTEGAYSFKRNSYPWGID